MKPPVAPLLATATTVTLLAIAAPAQATTAGPRDASATNLGSQATCYGTTSRSYFQTGGWGGQAGPYRTSSRCVDINVRNASAFSTQACVIFIDRTSNCNYWTYLPANSGWTTIATNVRDGVNFKVRFSNSYYQYEPLVAYHAY
ncbi:hypothetical protein [Micromonospora sagamiensis]|uniref:Uncharacterized protein n=1 Tax=Micromonospora sagamiensis TaxID=47875 RepID=A0A562WNE3_9ACTN|nr:hypothetical protein [Micromonospora sagamiensis]TWJ31873.1 hypothetical protein JD81_05439 [Micromonospora sagamiensis]BCL15073.1 hypothetical protein GCM10017556_28120 [Micromonospora sagamiensis]